MSDEQQKLRVRFVGRDRRRRHDPSSKARLVAACLELGVSISGLALAQGGNANVLRKWVKDARESGLPTVSSLSPFIPVVAGLIRPARWDVEIARGEKQPALMHRGRRRCRV